MPNCFYVRKIAPESIKQTINEIGFDENYLDFALNKYKFRLIKISNVSSVQANIIKQIALSVGADAAVHRDVIISTPEKTDLVIGATISQHKKIAKKLLHQQFSLCKISEMISKELTIKLKSLKIRNIEFDWHKKTYIMGILNVTPDSFSDGGKHFSIENAVKQAKRLIDEGADILDIGGESTRPFSQKVEPNEEIIRIIPVIKAIRQFNNDIVISADTRNSKTAKAAIESGADIINDVSSFDWDEKMLETVAVLDVPVIIMHSLNSPDKMQENPVYDENIVDAVYKFLQDKITLAINAGIKPENIIIDPGIGFGKTLEHNFELVKRAEEFSSLGCPILYGVSRKSLIAKVLDTLPDEREEANIALASFLASKGVNILRVHDVEKHKKALTVLDRILF
ncbi:MAG: dihydropteroate synthase [Candidatus Gastranaerophilales bacterium]|nr:dihydropteroate synthase [Candidatus Gastranaerophilales bacterium]